VIRRADPEVIVRIRAKGAGGRGAVAQLEKNRGDKNALRRLWNATSCSTEQIEIEVIEVRL
jgi:hypothetical protein